MLFPTRNIRIRIPRGRDTTNRHLILCGFVVLAGTKSSKLPINTTTTTTTWMDRNSLHPLTNLSKNESFRWRIDPIQGNAKKCENWRRSRLEWEQVHQQQQRRRRQWQWQNPTTKTTNTILATTTIHYPKKSQKRKRPRAKAANIETNKRENEPRNDFNSILVVLQSHSIAVWIWATFWIWYPPHRSLGNNEGQFPPTTMDQSVRPVA